MGDVVVSLDAELSWGYHDLEDAPPRVDRAREGWRTALDLLDRYHVPATWAIVGHLFLDDCNGRHDDHPLGGDWFSCGESGDWCAPDLVSDVRDASVGHEIGAHAFSHVPMNEPWVTDAVADAEFGCCQRAAAGLDLSLDSFVFPRNWIHYREELAGNDFTCYRGYRPKPWYADSRARPFLKLLDYSPVGRWTPVVEPTVDEYGLVNIPASLYLYSFQGRVRELTERLGYDPIVEVAKRGIDAVADDDGVFHVWLHPHNILQPGGRERFAAVLDYAARKRDTTDVTVRTMEAVADDFL